MEKLCASENANQVRETVVSVQMFFVCKSRELAFMSLHFEDVEK